jgi:hypothetical protein
MRDRLISLGMRRATRMEAEDFEASMLVVEDFDIEPLPDNTSCLPRDCLIVWDVTKQHQLAIMCIEMAKLCRCISHILSEIYVVQNTGQAVQNDRTTMLLSPKHLKPDAIEIKICDDELQKWQSELHENARRKESTSGDTSIDLHNGLLHMVFFAALAALHRPQVLSSTLGLLPANNKPDMLVEVPRQNLQRALQKITEIVLMLDGLSLVKYLPMTGVSVLLPTIITFILDIKVLEGGSYQSSLWGFCKCVQLMRKLCDQHMAADYAMGSVEAVIREVGIQLPRLMGGFSLNSANNEPQHVTTVNQLLDAGCRLGLDQLNWSVANPNLSLENDVGVLRMSEQNQIGLLSDWSVNLDEEGLIHEDFDSFFIWDTTGMDFQAR